MFLDLCKLNIILDERLPPPPPPEAVNLAVTYIFSFTLTFHSFTKNKKTKKKKEKHVAHATPHTQCWKTEAQTEAKKEARRVEIKVQPVMLKTQEKSLKICTVKPRG